MNWINWELVIKDVSGTNKWIGTRCVFYDDYTKVVNWETNNIFNVSVYC